MLMLSFLAFGTMGFSGRIWADREDMTRVQFSNALFCQRVSQAINDAMGNGMSDGSDCSNFNLYVSTAEIGNIETLNIVPPEGGFGNIDWETQSIGIGGTWTSDFYNLTSLSITNMYVNDILPLSNIRSNLTYLDLSGNKISDITPLETFKDKLVYLDLSDRIKPIGENINNLKDFTALTTLKVVRARISSLGGMFQPDEVEYDEETGEPLSEPETSSKLAKSLHIFDISNNTGISGEAAETMGYCDGNLRPFYAYASDLAITELYANKDDLNSDDLSCIAELRNLEKLDVSSNHIEDFSSIKNKTYTTLKADSQTFIRSVASLDYDPLPELFSQAGEENYFGGMVNASNIAVPLNELDLDNAQFNDTKVRFVDAVIASDQSPSPHPATVSVPEGSGVFENSKLQVYFSGQIVTFNDTNLCNEVYRQGENGSAFVNADGIRQPQEGPVVLTNACNTTKQIAMVSEGSSKFLTLKLDSVNNGDAVDLRGLEEFNGLEVLSLQNNSLTNISRLGNAHGLKRLWLNDNNLESDDWRSITDDLTDLRILYLNNNNMSNIPTEIGNLTSLGNLYLVNNGISDVSPLANATSLTVLDLSENAEISDFSGMIQEETACNPTILKMENAGVTHIPNANTMGRFSNLTSINLNGNQITDDTISNLAMAQKLDELYLNNNRISDTSGFSGIVNLTKLYLDNNQITSVSGLVSLNKLAELHLSNNNISGITGLETLPLLATLDLKNQTLTGTVTDVNGIYNLPAVFLQAMTLNFSRVIDFQSAGNYTITNGTIDYDDMTATMTDTSEEMTVTIPDGGLAGTILTATYSPSGSSEEPNWELIDNTGGGATITTISANVFRVTSEKACMVLWTNDNSQTWNRVNSNTVSGENNTREFNLEQVTSGAEIVVAYIGDVDGNNTLNVLDARAIVYHILEKTSLSKEQEKIADVDGNNTLNVLDARAIIYDILDKAKINW